jgi:excisionase family DNA binding protein
MGRPTKIRPQQVVELPPERYFRIREAATYLRAAPWFIGQAIRGGRLPHIKFGKTFVVDKGDLDKFAASLKTTETESRAA